MTVPLEIAFHNMDHSDAIETRVRERMERLARLHDRMTSCRVTIEAPHKRHQQGNRYQVRILIGAPQGQIAVTRDPGNMYAHEDVYVAIRDAFDAAERQVKALRQTLRGDVKTHDAPLQGRIARLFPLQDYGFIQTNDNREIYFHRNAVVDGSFDQLEEGQTVELVVFRGDSAQGPHASTVKLITPMSFNPTP